MNLGEANLMEGGLNTRKGRLEVLVVCGSFLLHSWRLGDGRIWEHGLITEGGKTKHQDGAWNTEELGDYQMLRKNQGLQKTRDLIIRRLRRGKTLEGAQREFNRL